MFILIQGLGTLSVCYPNYFSLSSETGFSRSFIAGLWQVGSCVDPEHPNRFYVCLWVRDFIKWLKSGHKQAFQHDNDPKQTSEMLFKNIKQQTFNFWNGLLNNIINV